MPHSLPLGTALVAEQGWLDSETAEMCPNIPNELAALLATGFLRARRRGLLEITEPGLEVPPETRLSGTTLVNGPETRRGERECR